MKSNKPHIIIWWLISLVVLSFSSCKKILEEPPSKTTSLVVSTTAHLDAVLNNYTTFFEERNRTTLYSSDDYGLTKALYDVRPQTFSSMDQIHYTLWDKTFTPLSVGSDLFWSAEWAKIFNANTVLSNVDAVSGTAEEKASLKADAHFIRAYTYWGLANTYALPYTEANKNEPGLTIKTSTSFEEPVARQSLEKTYQLIESDLVEALKTTVPLVQNGKARHWRANIASVHGFAARYYLNRFNYAKALEHANAALMHYSNLVDYNTEMRFGTPQIVTIRPSGGTAQSFAIQYPYTYNPTAPTDFTDMFAWKEFLYFRTQQNGTSWFIPSQALLNVYDTTNDLRYKYHMVEGYSYDRGMTNPAYEYPGYHFFANSRIPTGPTVAEMYLTKAESMARTGDMAGAMTALNTLRAKRMKPGAWVNLTAVTKDDAIKKVIEERRREMPFAQRWFDLRRYNNNEDANDDVELTKTFYPYTETAVLNTEPVKTFSLLKNSRRWAAPLPYTEIIVSNGAIQQNTY